MKGIRLPLALAGLVLTLVFETSPARAQNQTPESARPASTRNQVPHETRFLAGLQDAISTKDGKAGDPFEVRTLEPLEAASGRVLPAGAAIRGHIDKVERAHQSGRARLWLTFDEIQTAAGWVPIVAVVSDVPGVHSLKVAYDREGEIEVRSNKSQEDASAAAGGALVGAVPGVAARNGKEAAFGAAVGAATAFMIASGLGQELTLDKDTKIELTLDRPLTLGRR